MSNLKKAHELIRQNEKIVKKSQKHDVNLQKNSTLYFQVGLILCLLAAYGLFEMKFETKVSTYCDIPLLDEPYSIDIPLIKDERQTIDEPIEKQQRKQSNDFIEVPDDTPELPFVDEPKEPIHDTPVLNPDDMPDLLKEPTVVNVPIAFIQNAPIYPGCENKKNNFDRKKCMSGKISKLIQRKFDGSDIASNYGLSGKQKIDVQFTIDKTGHVINIKTRSPHPKLDKEAERVINFIPKMIPGKQNNQNVGVIYTLPIVFQVQN